MQTCSYAFIQNSAARRPDRWRLLVALVAGVLATAFLGPLLIGTLASTQPELRPYAGAMPPNAIGTTPGGAFIILSWFCLPLVTATLLARRLHDRAPHELTGPSALMRAHFWRVLKFALILMAVLMFLPWDQAPENVQQNLQFSEWLFWLPFALLALIIQVSAEEILFRGYIMAQLVHSTRSRLLGAVISSLVFGLLHFNAADGLGAAAFHIFWTFLFGLVAADLTFRSGTLGPAIALHFVNNAAATLLSPVDGMLSGFGLYVQTVDRGDLLMDPMIISFELLMLLVSWLVARLALRR